MITRRNFIKTIPKAAAGWALINSAPALAQPSRSSKVEQLLSEGQLTEDQYSDPTEKPELLAFAPGMLQKALQAPAPLLPRKNSRAVALRMRDISRMFAENHVGRMSRPPDQVREVLGLFDFDLRYERSDTYVPYCAAGVSYAACRAFCDVPPKVVYDPDAIGYFPNRLSTIKARLREIREYLFIPSPAVRMIEADAKDRNTWTPANADPLPGWLVVFSWNGSRPNHIGIVDQAESKVIHTIEYNTTITEGDQRNGGIVAKKARARNDTIMGFVKTY